MVSTAACAEIDSQSSGSRGAGPRISPDHLNTSGTAKNPALFAESWANQKVQIPANATKGSCAEARQPAVSSGFFEDATPLISAEERKKLDEEWEELCPTYRLNNIEPEPQEQESEGTAEPAQKKWRWEPHIGLPPHAFCGVSSSLGARASMLRTGSSAFAIGAACKQALFGGLEKELWSVRYSEQLSTDIRLVTQAMLDRISKTAGMKTLGGEDYEPAQADRLIEEKARQFEFYVGISERPVERFQEHQSSGYSEMHVMLFSDSKASGNMEKRLISTWQKHPHCMNAGPGGLRASEGKPHFCYIVFRAPGLKR